MKLADPCRESAKGTLSLDPLHLDRDTERDAECPFYALLGFSKANLLVPPYLETR